MNDLIFAAVPPNAGAPQAAAGRDDKPADAGFAGVLAAVAAPPNTALRGAPADRTPDHTGDDDSSGDAIGDAVPDAVMPPFATDLSALAQAALVAAAPQVPVAPPSSPAPTGAVAGLRSAAPGAGHGGSPSAPASSVPVGPAGSQTAPPGQAETAMPGRPAQADPPKGKPTAAPVTGLPAGAVQETSRAAIVSGASAGSPRPDASTGPATADATARPAPIGGPRVEAAAAPPIPPDPGRPQTGTDGPSTFHDPAATEPSPAKTPLQENATGGAMRDASTADTPAASTVARVAAAETAQIQSALSATPRKGAGSPTPAIPPSGAGAPGEAKNARADTPAAAATAPREPTPLSATSRRASATPDRPDKNEPAAPADAGAVGAGFTPAAAPPAQQVAVALQSLAASTRAAPGPAELASTERTVSVTQVASSATVDIKVLKIDLDPGHLGPVSVTMRQVGDAVTIHIAVANPDTLRILERDKHLLSSAVEALGGSTDALQIVTPAGSAPDGAGQGSASTGSGRQDAFSSDASSNGRQAQGQGRHAFRAEQEIPHDDPLSPSALPSRRLDGSLYV